MNPFEKIAFDMLSVEGQGKVGGGKTVDEKTNLTTEQCETLKSMTQSFPNRPMLKYGAPGMFKPVLDPNALTKQIESHINNEKESDETQI